ncbi:MAG: tetratricopeptide repeat protein [Terriglobales bacterium]
MRSVRTLVPWALLLLVLVAFWPAFQSRYTFDDVLMVQRNPAVHSLASWRQLIRQDYWFPYDASGLYRPLTLLTFAAQWALFPDHAGWMHALDLLLHFGVAWLVFCLGRRVLPELAAAFAALWFALLPTQVEVVVGLVGRSDLLAALGVLLSLWAVDRSLPDTPHSAHWGLWTAAATGFAFLALVSKESALPVAAFAALWIWLRLPSPTDSSSMAAPGWRRVLTTPAWWGIVAATLVYVVIRVRLFTWRLPLPGVVSAPLAYVAWPTRIRTATWVALQQVLALIWPVHLSPDYSLKQIPLIYTWYSGRFWIALATLVALGAAAFLGRRRPAVLLGAGFALLAYLPVSNWLIPIGTIRASRLLYLPAVGVAWLLGGLVSSLRPMKSRTCPSTAWMMVVGLLFGAYVLTDMHESRYWRDDAHLMRMAVARSPNSANTHLSLAYELNLENQPDEALREYQRAVAIYPNFAHAWWGMAGIMFHQGRMAEAAMYNLRAFDLEPTEPVYLDLAEAQLASGQAALIIPEAHRLPIPVSVPVALTVARSYLALQQFQRAATVLTRILGREPGNAAAHLYAAAAFHGLGDDVTARQQLAQAHALNPDLQLGNGAGPRTRF